MIQSREGNFIPLSMNLLRDSTNLLTPMQIFYLHTEGIVLLHVLVEVVFLGRM